MSVGEDGLFDGDAPAPENHDAADGPGPAPSVARGPEPADAEASDGPEPADSEASDGPAPDEARADADDAGGAGGAGGADPAAAANVEARGDPEAGRPHGTADAAAASSTGEAAAFDVSAWLAALLDDVIEPAAPGAPDLGAVSLDALRAEVDRRQRTVSKLLREKDRLRARLAEIDRQVTELSPAPGEAAAPLPVAVSYRKPLSDLTVAEAVARVFEIGEEFSPSDAAERLLDGGFQTRASNFRQIVSQTLARETRFRRMARGLYQRTA